MEEENYNSPLNGEINKKENSENGMKEPLSWNCFCRLLYSHRKAVIQSCLVIIALTISFSLSYNYFRVQTVTVLVPSDQTSACETTSSLFTMPAISGSLGTPWLIFYIPAGVNETNNNEVIYNISSVYGQGSWQSCSHAQTGKFEFSPKFGINDFLPFSIPPSTSSPYTETTTVTVEMSKDKLINVDNGEPVEDDDQSSYYSTAGDEACFTFQCKAVYAEGILAPTGGMYLTPETVKQFAGQSSNSLISASITTSGSSLTASCDLNVFGTTYPVATVMSNIIRSPEKQCTIRTSTTNALTLALAVSLTVFSVLRLSFFLFDNLFPILSRKEKNTQRVTYRLL